MVFEPFMLKALLSGVVGGCYIAGTLRLSEKYGSHLGGILVGMPSTVLIGLIFICWTLSPDAMITAGITTIMSLGASALFLTIVARYYRQLGLGAAILGAICWFVLSTIARIRSGEHLHSALLIGVPLVLCAIFLLRTIPSRTLPTHAFSRNAFMIRAVCAGTVIASAVLASAILNPAIGGIIAGFPAAALPAFFLLVYAHDISFAESFLKAVPCGILSNIAFLTSLVLLTPHIGAVLAIISGLIVAILTAFAITRLCSQKKGAS